MHGEASGTDCLIFHLATTGKVSTVMPLHWLSLLQLKDVGIDALTLHRWRVRLKEPERFEDEGEAIPGNVPDAGGPNGSVRACR